MPRWEHLQPAKMAQGGPESARSAPLTVLVADDEPIVRMVLEDMLHRLGFRVLAAEDGLQALDVFKLHDEHIDLMVFDLSMPNMDGEELFAEIRRLSPETKTVMITGYNEIVSLDNMRRMGLSGYIAKPFGVDEIRTELSRVLTA